MSKPINISGFIGKYTISTNKNSIIKVLIKTESGKYIVFEDKDGNLDHFYLYLQHNASITNTVCNYLRVYINYFKIRPTDLILINHYREDGKNIFIYKLNHILPSKANHKYFIPKQSNFINCKFLSIKELKKLNLYCEVNDINDIEEKEEQKDSDEKKNKNKK